MNLGRVGKIDWGDWLYGLGAAIIGGGANAVVAAFALVGTDPQHFNLQTGAFYKIVFTTFGVSGLINAFMFLRTKPLPAIRTTTVTTETTDTSTPRVKAVTTVKETTITPVETEPKSAKG